MKHYKYPSTGQFRNVVKAVEHEYCYTYNEATDDYERDLLATPPTLTFIGTVKAHGTNASVVLKADGTFYAQSRNNTITIENDNAGFAAFVHKNREYFIALNQTLRVWCVADDFDIVVYGEWCGGSIQKGVALNQLDKRWLVFGLKFMGEGGSEWEDTSVLKLFDFPLLSIYNINTFGKYEIDIDFSNPSLAQNKMIELVDAVEKECPIGKHFGVSGVGEGIVFKYGTHTFKVKGEKHSISKVKTLAPVDTEKLNSITEFVEYAVTENRLEQAVENTLVCGSDSHGRFYDFDRKNLGKFIKAVSADIVKEESDVLVDNGLCMKDVGKAVSDKTRRWFFEQEDTHFTEGLFKGGSNG